MYFEVTEDPEWFSPLKTDLLSSGHHYAHHIQDEINEMGQIQDDEITLAFLNILCNGILKQLLTKLVKARKCTKLQEKLSV